MPAACDSGAMAREARIEQAAVDSLLAFELSRVVTDTGQELLAALKLLMAGLQGDLTRQHGSLQRGNDFFRWLSNRSRFARGNLGG